MSFETWEKEFYSVDAHEVNRADVTDVNLVLHSLRKWKGLLPKNLERHGLTLKDGDLYENGKATGFGIHSGTCSLCSRYNGEDRNGDALCPGCPLYETRGRIRCDVRSSSEREKEKLSPYDTMTRYGDVRPMLAELNKALKWARKQELQEIQEALDPLPKCVLKLLAYSWSDADYSYQNLTAAETLCLTEREFNQIVEQIKAANLITKH